MSSGHYLKILNPIVEQALAASLLSAAGRNPRRTIFNEITNSGTELQYVELPQDLQGERICIFGQTIFCEARVDKERQDCLAISSIGPSAGSLADRKKLIIHRTVIELVGEPRVPSAKRDPVRQLFFRVAQTTLPQQGKNSVSLVKPLIWPPATRTGVVHAQLSNILARVPEDVRSLWRPQINILAVKNPKAILHDLRTLWKRYGVEESADDGRREDRSRKILRGVIKPDPEKFTNEDAACLIAIFDMSLLNTFARRSESDTEQLCSLFKELAGQPISESMRAIIWGSMVAALTPDAVRREIYETKVALDALAENSTRAESWALPLLEGMRVISIQYKDQDLQGLIDESSTAEQFLSSLAAWGNQFVIRASSVPPNPATSVRTDDFQAQAFEGTGQSTQQVRGFQEEGGVSIEPSPVLAPPNISALDRWVLQRCMTEPARLPAIRDEIQEQYAELLGCCDSLNTVAGVRDALRGLQALTTSIERWERDLPVLEKLDDDMRVSERVYKAAVTLIGNGIDELLDQKMLPEDLDEVVQIMRTEGVLAKIPAWIWLGVPTDDPMPLVAPTPRGRFERLINRDVRGRVRIVLSTIERLRGDPSALDLLVPPAQDADVDRYIETTLEDTIRRNGVLREVSVEHRAWVDLALEAGTEARRVLDLLQVLEELRGVVDADVFASILLKLCVLSAQDIRESAVEDYNRASKWFIENLGNAFGISVQKLDAWITRNPSTSSGAVRAVDLKFEHNWLDPKVKAPLVFYKYSEADRPYGVVCIPLAIEINRPVGLHFKLDVEFKTNQREAWSSDWELPTPHELRVAQADWRDHPYGRGYLYTFKLVIPMREPGSKIASSEYDRRLRVTVMGRSLSDGQEIIPKREFTWDVIPRRDGELSILWPEGINTDYIARHPIGPQRELKRIEHRIINGNSFAVIAPRRFGKTTLVEYLKTFDQHPDLMVLEPVDCTFHVRGNGFDYQGVWRKLSEEFQRRLSGTSITGSSEDGIPSQSAFDYVRKSAWQLGKKVIMILFDEAQLFFPKTTGYLLGDRFKGSSELHWSRHDMPDMARVVFGFVGLPSLRDRAGRNLIDMLDPVDIRDISEGELSKVILDVSKQALYIMREARMRLARIARNLLVMRTLLERTVGLLNSERRAWAGYDDIIAVERSLRSELSEGVETRFTSSIRDAFNDAESINVWRPSPCYPVALAMARARQGHYRGAALRVRVADILREWTHEAEADLNCRFTYPEERIAEHFNDLRDRGVIEGDEFRSELVEAWLLGRTRSGYPQEEPERQALISGAIVRVRIPEIIDPISKGGQAEIGRFSRDGIFYAVRRVKLSGEEDRRRFVESLEMLSMLRKGRYRAAAGADFIFDLKEIGLAADDDMVAVQTYRWIVGASLDTRLRDVAPPFVADLGFKLATAVQWLHSQDILHRDIRPANIVLSDEGFKPILIDFGLARLANSTMVTTVNDDYAAPEVRSPSPIWSRAADLYSLGATLRHLQSESSNVVLQSILAQCCSVRREDRPTAQELVSIFKEATKTLHVATIRDQAWSTVSAIVPESERMTDWYWTVVERKFQPQIMGMALGCYRDMFDRCRVIANLLNQVLEAFPLRSDQLSLGNVKRKRKYISAELDTPEIRFLHRMRVGDVHERTHNRETIVAEFGLRDSQEIRDFTLRGAALIGAALQITSLGGIVAAVLGGNEVFAMQA